MVLLKCTSLHSHHHLHASAADRAVGLLRQPLAADSFVTARDDEDVRLGLVQACALRTSLHPGATAGLPVSFSVATSSIESACMRIRTWRLLCAPRPNATRGRGLPRQSVTERWQSGKNLEIEVQ